MNVVVVVVVVVVVMMVMATVMVMVMLPVHQTELQGHTEKVSLIGVDNGRME